MTLDELDELAAQYEQREPYRFSDMGRPDAVTGKMRVRGPAVTGKVRCDNHPTSKAKKPTRKRQTTACRRDEPCGCGVTVTLTPESGYLTTYQRVTYGTRKWQALYWRRTQVESSNAELKYNRARLSRTSYLVRGRERVGLLLGCLLMAVNILMACDWFGMDWAELQAQDETLPRVQRRNPRKKARKAAHRRLGEAPRPG